MRRGCDPATLLRALEAATARLAERVDHVNELNVYPVPDGDTGTNMLHTMRSALAAAREAKAEAGEILAAAAHGALMGARGNSGVILSQILAGARAALSRGDMDAPRVVEAFVKAREAAYEAVVNPVEGTILTCIREMADAVRAHHGDGVGALLDRALAAGREATAKTPDLLPVHKRAGVVDAGAQGLVYVVEGVADLVNGRRAREYREEIGAARPAAQVVAVTQAGGEWGYDVQFLITEPKRPPAKIREEMLGFGLEDASLACVLVVGDESVAKVHVHTTQPHEIIRIGLAAGPLRDIVVENLDEMAAARERETGVAISREEMEMRPLAAVAVVSGPGLATVARSLGATPLHGGPTVNPSVQDLLDAIARAPGERVLVLPNDKNVLLTAQTAATQAAKPVRVVPTTTMAQGLAALVRFETHGELESVGAGMEESAMATRSIEVARATRDATVGGIAVREGEFMALVDGALVGAASTPEDALRAGAGELGGAELCTLYVGADAERAGAERAARLLRETLGCEVEVVNGGQPHFPYIVSAE